MERRGFTVQPRYEKLVRLRPRGWGITARKPNGQVEVRPLGRTRFEMSR